MCSDTAETDLYFDKTTFLWTIFWLKRIKKKFSITVADYLNYILSFISVALLLLFMTLTIAVNFGEVASPNFDIKLNL